MSGFAPLTLGYDWEVWALKPDMLPAEGKKYEPIAARINTELAPMEGHREWIMIECGAGITQSWPELAERTRRYYDWVQEQFAKEDLVIFPSGSIVTCDAGAGLHVHAGTIADARSELHLLHAFVRYIPVFMALMVNSPLGTWRSGEWKSYRMGGANWGSGGPYPISHAHLAGPVGWGDVCFRRGTKPTLEFRLCDSCLSPQLASEYALLIAGVADWIVNRPDVESADYSTVEFEEFVANRWRAARDGLQATLVFGGCEIEAAECVQELIEKAGPGMRKLGASEEDLVIIPRMLALRQTPADFQQAYLSRFTDPLSGMRAIADVLKDAEAFQKYLDFAPELPPKSADELLSAVLAKIGRETALQELGNAPWIPPLILEEQLRRLEADGKVVRELTPEDGIRISATAGRAAMVPK